MTRTGKGKDSDRSEDHPVDLLMQERGDAAKIAPAIGVV
jgi:hypothetical protein